MTPGIIPGTPGGDTAILTGGKTEVRGQMSEVRGKKSEKGNQGTNIPPANSESHEEYRLIHDLVVNNLKRRLSREFQDIRVNLYGEKKHAFKDLYPDLIVSNHGMVILVIEVETESSLSQQKAEIWKKISDTGTKLNVIVPRELKVKATELLWQTGLAGKVSIGTYELNINMP